MLPVSLAFACNFCIKYRKWLVLMNEFFCFPFFFSPMKPVNEKTSCLGLTDWLYTCTVVLLAGNAVDGYWPRASGLVCPPGFEISEYQKRQAAMTVRKVTKQKGEATRRYQVILLLLFSRLAGLLCLLIAVYSFLNLLCVFFLLNTFFINKK